MSIIEILVFLVVVGFALWLVSTYIPMEPPFKIILKVVIVLILVAYILQIFGLLPAMHLKMPH